MLTEKWSKSSRSAANGNCVEAKFEKSTRSHVNNCVEVAYKRSTRCDNSGPNCVEVGATADGVVLVRDSKEVVNSTSGPVLAFDGGSWGAFLAGVEAGEFDR
jgi:hypothetical protein